MKNIKKQTIQKARIEYIMQILRKNTKNWDEKLENLALKIIDVFYDTELGEGIGFYEADAHDDYDPEWQIWRQKDERIYWEKIFAMKFDISFPQKRFHPYSAFTFMDGLGRRFALPCYLLWELQGDDMSLSYYLKDSFYTENLFLNKQQQNLLYEYVQFMINTCTWNEDWQTVQTHLSQQFEYFK